MTTQIDPSAGEQPFATPVDDQTTEWAAIGDSDLAAHQAINDRRAQQESAETLRLMRAL